MLAVAFSDIPLAWLRKRMKQGWRRIITRPDNDAVTYLLVMTMLT